MVVCLLLPAYSSLCCALIGSFGLPGVVEQFDHFVVENEDYGHIQTHPAQSGNCALVEPRERQRDRERDGYGTRKENPVAVPDGSSDGSGGTHACGPSFFRILKAQSTVLV